MSKTLADLVAEAMTDSWNDICSDTGCHPLDLERSGNNLTFVPRHWASAVARQLEANILDREGLMRCTICGFVVDTSLKTEKPTAEFTTRGRR